MENIADIQRLKKNVIAWLSLLLLISMFGNVAQIFAHGGEDHGDEKPKTTASDKGTVSHSMRLGDYELMLKHPHLVPDTATVARLFITRFETNESIDKATPAIEIESANGSITQAIVEKNNAGGYTVKIAALPQGEYTIRTRLTYDGEIDTATFSGVRVASKNSSGEIDSSMSWPRTALIGTIFALVLALFGGLVYFVWRYADGEPVNNDTVSA